MKKTGRWIAALLVAGALTVNGCATTSQAAEAKGPAAEIEAKKAAEAAANAESTAAEASAESASDSAKESGTASAESSAAAKAETKSETEAAKESTAATKETGKSAQSAGEISLNPNWKYAANSKINSGKAVLYKASENRKGKVICVNAGHGTSGGEKVKTLSHPDGTPKSTGGTNAAGAVESMAISAGTTFRDGTPESKVTLETAKILKDKLLAKGYDVLMIRESDDVQLDNVARTVIANNAADCHIALHWDSTNSDKGAFYMGVCEDDFRKMEPVASHWQEHEALGKALIKGLREKEVKIWKNESLASDLTQTSYSTVPSVDIELGDTVSDHSKEALTKIANGLAAGVDHFYN